jgi:hypothetical protein
VPRRRRRLRGVTGSPARSRIARNVSVSSR